MIMNNKYIRLDTNKTTEIKNILYSWFKDYNPQYFLSIQFPKYRRSANLENNEANLYKIMSTFERLALGRHWNKKHIPFFAIAEHGKSINWHYHVLIYDCNFNFFQVQYAFQQVSFQLHLPHEVLLVEQVYSNGVNDYTSKEFKANIKKHFDSDRIITSEILFNIPYKSITHIKESQKQPQNHKNKKKRHIIH